MSEAKVEQEASAPKIRVMIVDDEVDLAAVLAQLLSDRFEVVLAANGLEALERIDRYEPEVIVMDVMMPVLDGFDTTRAIKKNAKFANVPVLFLTARTDNRSVREGLLSGGEIYLQKPFVPDIFMSRIDELISRNHVQPRAHSYTVDEIEAFYRGEPDTTASQQRAEPAQDVHSGPVPVTIALHPTVSTQQQTAPLTSGSASSRNTTGSSVGGMRLTDKLAEATAEPRLRVLIVDDEADIVKYIKSVLAQNFEVIGTTDSESAPDKILSYQPDILLLDINMPRLNGFHLSQLIRLNKRLRGSKVIFVSSRSDRESVEQAFKVGASDFLEKPFTPEQLRRKISEVTRKPDFARIKKRITYSEILRREGELPA